MNTSLASPDSLTESGYIRIVVVHELEYVHLCPGVGRRICKT
jgi:hypothetical protein